MLLSVSFGTFLATRNRNSPWDDVLAVYNLLALEEKALIEKDGAEEYT
jgi:hypothetical protein